MASSPPPQDSPSGALANLRLSIDSNPPDTSAVNGRANGHNSNLSMDGVPEATPDGEEQINDVERLQQELERTRAEKEVLGDQYRSLLAKLTAMRTTLGNKLKEDAEELDRREQLLQQLTSQNDELSLSVNTLRDELVLASNESQKLSEELSVIRSRAVEDSAHEASIRERQMQDMQAELEMCRTERDDWERAAQHESVAADEARTAVAMARRDLEMEEAKREKDRHDLEMERAKSANLQSVLEDFQSTKEAELRSALGESDAQMLQVTQMLAEFKSRALRAEAELSEITSSTRRVSEVEQELKEKTALVGKLRHESVIANEHLTEALRRLRRNSSDENVDRRLITNVLLSYLSTARGDSKRYEMLSLLASILSWSETDREMAGLQKTTQPLKTRKSVIGSRPMTVETPKVEDSESFSKMWVEFLMKEAAQGATDATPPSAASTPTATSFGSPLWSPAGMRSPSVTLSRLPLPNVPTSSSSTTPEMTPSNLRKSSFT